MNTTRLLLLAGASVFLVPPPWAWAQSPPPAGQGPGRPRDGTTAGRPGGGDIRGPGRPDPVQMFDLMSRGKDVVNRADLDPNLQRLFDRYARRMGLTGET